MYLKLVGATGPKFAIEAG